jgi:amidophosphoribosyltransferase
MGVVPSLGFDIHDPEDRLHEECGLFGVFAPNPNDPITAAIGRGRLLRSVRAAAPRAGKRGNRRRREGRPRPAPWHGARGGGLFGQTPRRLVRPRRDRSCPVLHRRVFDDLHAQPLMAQSKLGTIAIGHNGNLVNAPVIRDLLEDAGVMFQTSSDSEVIPQSRRPERPPRPAPGTAGRDARHSGRLFPLLLTEDSLIAVRDPKGSGPSCSGGWARRPSLPARVVPLMPSALISYGTLSPARSSSLPPKGWSRFSSTSGLRSQVCSFEFVYFSRPDSEVDGVSVYASRLEAGRILYREAPVDADVVSGVPDSGVVAAHGYAEAAGLPYAMTLIKNKYVGRSFIAPTQELRERAVSVKLNALRHNVTGKRIVLIDDSIVRGTTMATPRRHARRAGATEVHIRIASPPVRHACYFGMDYPSRNELAGRRGVEEVRAMIGADSLAYLSLPGLHASLGVPASSAWVSEPGCTRSPRRLDRRRTRFPRRSPLGMLPRQPPVQGRARPPVGGVHERDGLPIGRSRRRRGAAARPGHRRYRRRDAGAGGVGASRRLCGSLRPRRLPGSGPRLRHRRWGRSSNSLALPVVSTRSGSISSRCASTT